MTPAMADQLGPVAHEHQHEAVRTDAPARAPEAPQQRPLSVIERGERILASDERDERLRRHRMELRSHAVLDLGERVLDRERSAVRADRVTIAS